MIVASFFDRRARYQDGHIVVVRYESRAGRNLSGIADYSSIFFRCDTHRGKKSSDQSWQSARGTRQHQKKRTRKAELGTIDLCKGKNPLPTTYTHRTRKVRRKSVQRQISLLAERGKKVHVTVKIDVYLAFIETVIGEVDKFDLKRPLAGSVNVKDTDPFVVGVGRPAGRYDPPVRQTNPRDLSSEKPTLVVNFLNIFFVLVPVSTVTYRLECVCSIRVVRAYESGANVIGLLLV